MLIWRMNDSTVTKAIRISVLTVIAYAILFYLPGF
jgi:hypothetical protein